MIINYVKCLMKAVDTSFPCAPYGLIFYQAVLPSVCIHTEWAGLVTSAKMLCLHSHIANLDLMAAIKISFIAILQKKKILHFAFVSLKGQFMFQALEYSLKFLRHHFNCYFFVRANVSPDGSDYRRLWRHKSVTGLWRMGWGMNLQYPHSLINNYLTHLKNYNFINLESIWLN